MAEMTILLRRDPRTGKQNIVVKLDSDPDALPIEHEQLHRKLIEKLLGKGLNPEDLGEIVIEREGERKQEVPATAEGETQRQKAGHKG
jgi:FtsH ternary system domain X3-analog